MEYDVMRFPNIHFIINVNVNKDKSNIKKTIKVLIESDNNNHYKASRSL